MEKGSGLRNKILVFGDSITYGQVDLELGGWVNGLRLRIANDSSVASCHVFNMGIPGQTSIEVLERFDRECKGRFRPDANNVIILAAGINDTQMVGGEVLVSEDDFRTSVNTLIEQARNYTSKLLYVGLTPVDESRTNPVWWDGSKNWRNDLVERYDSIIQEVCREQGVRYIHMFDRIDPLTNADGLHPSAEGHRIMTEAVSEEVYGFLDRLSPVKAAAMKTAGTRPAKRAAQRPDLSASAAGIPPKRKGRLKSLLQKLLQIRR